MNEDLTKGLKKGKPFLDRVWSTISHFQTTISDKTKLELSGHISPEVILQIIIYIVFTKLIFYYIESGMLFFKLINIRQIRCSFFS